jgi:hypothetical protein
MRFQIGLSWVGAFVIALGAGCGGSGGGEQVGESSLRFSVDGAQVDSSEQGVGVDPAGQTVVLAATADSSLEIWIPRAAPGSYSSDSASGARVVYTDPDGNAFEAADALAGSAYALDVTSYAAGRVQATFSATVVGPGGQTHTLEGSFDVAFLGLLPSDPYAGTYLGIFRLQGQRFEGYQPDPPYDPIYGPLETFSFRVTLRLQPIGSNAGIAVYNITHANISDPFFACQLGGCTPDPFSSAMLPDPPGTPAPSGPSKQGTGIVLVLPSGGELYTWALNDAGQIYTSTDARMLGNAQGVTKGWEGSDGSDPYSTRKLGSGPKPDSFRQTWALTRSAL